MNLVAQTKLEDLKPWSFKDSGLPDISVWNLD